MSDTGEELLDVFLLPGTLRDFDVGTTGHPTKRKASRDHIPSCQKTTKEDKWPWLQEKATLSNGVEVCLHSHLAR